MFSTRPFFSRKKNIEKHQNLITYISVRLTGVAVEWRHASFGGCRWSNHQHCRAHYSKVWFELQSEPWCVLRPWCRRQEAKEGLDVFMNLILSLKPQWISMHISSPATLGPTLSLGACDASDRYLQWILAPTWPSTSSGPARTLSPYGAWGLDMGWDGAVGSILCTSYHSDPNNQWINHPRTQMPPLPGFTSRKALCKAWFLSGPRLRWVVESACKASKSSSYCKAVCGWSSLDFEFMTSIWVWGCPYSDSCMWRKANLDIFKAGLETSC